LIAEDEQKTRKKQIKKKQSGENYQIKKKTYNANKEKDEEIEVNERRRRRNSTELKVLKR